MIKLRIILFSDINQSIYLLSHMTQVKKNIKKGYIYIYIYKRKHFIF